MLLDRFARTESLAALDPAESQLAIAMRLWVVMRKLGRCPILALGERLGSARAGAHLHLLMEEIGAAWPDPFCAAPPCCPRLSHDEATVLAMFRLARAGDRPGHDRLLSDLLPADLRERLFLSASVLGRVLPG